ncbi:MAG TPA: methyltransferase domain-containing protein [Armatimonadota bacterium]|jgi:SAM-dependent methyltransferase
MRWPETFAERAEAREYLDGGAIPPATLRANLREQACMNRWLGGNAAVSCAALPYLRACRAQPLRVLEIGCGGADLSRGIVRALLAQRQPVIAVGLDIRRDVLTCARDQWRRAYPELALVCADALSPPFPPASFDVVIIPTLLHHLSPDEAVAVLRVGRRLSHGLVIVTDLVRSPWAYLGFSLVARALRFSPVGRHDGALSIRRAYTPCELAALAEEAGLTDGTIYRAPWFRMALVYHGG